MNIPYVDLPAQHRDLRAGLVAALERVLDRIPADFRPRIAKVLVGDDASQDSTHLVALGYQQINTDLPIEVVRHP